MISRIEDPPAVDDSETDQREEDVAEKHCERATEYILSEKMPWDRFCQGERTEYFLKRILPIKKAPKGQELLDVANPSIGTFRMTFEDWCLVSRGVTGSPVSLTH